MAHAPRPTDETQPFDRETGGPLNPNFPEVPVGGFQAEQFRREFGDIEDLVPLFGSGPQRRIAAFSARSPLFQSGGVFFMGGATPRRGSKQTEQETGRSAGVPSVLRR